MFIQETLEVINAFLERYVPYTNEQGDYTDIKTVDGKVRFTFNNDYYLYAWIKDGELNIETEYGESVYDFANCHDWTDSDVHYMKYGKTCCSCCYLGEENGRFFCNMGDSKNYGKEVTARNYCDEFEE